MSLSSPSSPSSPPPSPPSPISSTGEGIKKYEVFRDYIKHEDDLVNNRVTWLSQIHGFLYATFGFCIQKKLEITQQIASNLKMEPADVYMQRAHLGSSILEIDLFMLFIAVIGLLLSRYSSKSIVAALRAQNSICALFSDQSNPVEYPIKNSNAIRIYGVKKPLGEVLQINCGDTYVHLPMIAGGGSPRSHKFGFIAPTRIPAILFWGWVAALVYFIFDFYVNYDYLFVDVVRFLYFAKSIIVHVQ